MIEVLSDQISRKHGMDTCIDTEAIYSATINDKLLDYLFPAQRQMVLMVFLAPKNI